MQQLTHLNNTSSIRNKNSDNRYRTRYRDYNKMIVYIILYVYGKRTSFFFSFSICLSICIELHVCISVML